MTERAGVLRSGPGLLAAADELRKIGQQQSARPSLAAWEATNLHLLATAMVASATLRTETRGSHWREDYPEPSPDWVGHLIVTVDQETAGHATSPAEPADGLSLHFEPAPEHRDG
jgi:L-aspartate oxidase